MLKYTVKLLDLLHIIDSHQERGIALTLNELTSLTNSKYNTTWNRLRRLRNLEYITRGTNTYLITPKGKTYLKYQKYQKYPKTECTKTHQHLLTSTSVATATKKCSSPLKTSLLIFSGIILTLMAQEIMTW